MRKMTEEAKLKRSQSREKNKALQEEKRLESLLNSELLKLKQYPMTTPQFQFKVGDKIKPRTAHWDFMIVLEVIDEGRILKCEIYSKNNEKTIRYIHHLEALPENFEESSDFSNHLSSKRQISFHNASIDSLFSYHYSFGIDYNPSYQRELCWDLKDKEKLIESIFNAVEIGKFVMVELPYKENSPGFEILDGKQRLTTLIQYYEDQFSYRGKTFSQLSQKDKNHFLNYNITLGRGDESWTLKDKMEYFLKLNVSGVPQSEDHLNKVRQDLLKMSESK